MLYFTNDYSEGAHPTVLKKLVETNGESLPGYGTDKYSLSAKEKIRAACGCPQAEIFFLNGGTQTNLIVISALLKGWEGVIAAESGHISVHEAGAIEHTGHKVLTLPQHNGKIDAVELKKYINGFYSDENHEHMTFPGMVYISHPTEYGTLYSKSELTAISEICGMYKIPLYMDGARLGYGLVCHETDLTLPDIAKLCDVFYIGGTKVGALCGEAVVFTKNNVPRCFTTTIKQLGGLGAKGRLYGVQFDALFTDGLYFEISKNAVDCAQRLQKALKEKGYRLYMESPTNQIFVVLDNEKLDKLKRKVQFSFWEKYDISHTVVRFATSWATDMGDVEKLIEIL